MKTKSTLCFIACLSFPIFLFAQSGPSDPAYVAKVEAAFEFLKNGDCKNCLQTYEQAFDLSKHSALSHLRAATCAESCGDMAKRNSLIQMSVEIAWDVCLNILASTDNYPEFKPWLGTDFEKIVKAAAQQQGEAKGINFALMEELNQLQEEDQKYRRMLDSVRYEHPEGTPEYQAFITEWIRSDSLNLVWAEKILVEHGYPGKSMVGVSAAGAIWLVIQHAPLEKQEQYLPLITEAADKGEILKSNWALLIDRIRMRQGKTQLYGSQVVRDEATGQWKLHDIEDEANVNKLRAEAGMEPLEDYARRFGVEWKPPTGKH